MPRSLAERATPSLIDPPRVETARIASVALLRPLDHPYSYIVPDQLADSLKPGMRVSVPFGRADKPTTGWCLSISEDPWRSSLKPIMGLIDDAPLLSPAMLELGQWLSSYYASHLGRTLDLMVPASTKRGAGLKRVRYVRRATLEPTNQSHGDLDTPPRRLSPAQARVLQRLEAANDTPIRLDELTDRAACSAAVVSGLKKRGLVRIETRMERSISAPAGDLSAEPTFDLNEDQRRAIDQITTAQGAGAFSVQVLFGVTGSGKTEVYVAAIRAALDAGRQAILLVPEIALTTQTVRRLQQRFPRVATIHSGMSDVERSRAWAEVASGHANVVIGTRSAVFAPCPQLGIIIVDEEAEPSYKSQSSPRYHTRDVAVKRAQIEKIPVILGSATPSLETWHNIQRFKHYRLIRMPSRVRGLAMPTMHLVDMNEEHRARPGVHMMSRILEDKLAETLQRGEQAVILLNRRGYASYLHCAKCRRVMSCPHCSVRLVFHKSTTFAHCHYCGERVNVPPRCTNIGCDGTMVKFGLGTERVEEQIVKRFPDARVRRIDSDVMGDATDYADLLGAFERREFDVLVGTQMVAKGLDFPFVSFVGVISADTALALDDFRSEERTFQLVLQVAGRSGRGDTGGHVVVQTFAADTAPIQHAVRGDYEGFANAELRRRREANLPPYTRMVRMILADAKRSRVKTAAEDTAAEMRRLFDKHGIQATIFDARPSNIERLRDLYRFDIVTIFPTAAALLAAVAIMKDESLLRPGVASTIIDVDPVSLQ